ncbi:PRC-barrel domain-containing protein [Actinomycetes bacterium M1A6_2h]
MLFSEAKGRKIVSTTTADTVGKIHGFVVDAESRSVLAVTVKKADSGDTLAWPNIAGFGADAVTVTGADQISAADAEVQARSGKDKAVLGKRVLSTGGAELGSVKDVEFDPSTGSITSLVLESSSVPGAGLIGIGSYAVVVDEG